MNLKNQTDMFGVRVVANMFGMPEPKEAGGICDVYLCCAFGCGYNGVTYYCYDFICDVKYQCWEEHSCWDFTCSREYTYHGSC